MDFSLEKKFSGLVVGIDEAGRGPLAGPVVAAAVAFTNYDLAYLAEINDSKKLTKAKREKIYAKLQADASVLKAVAQIDSEIIDQVNIFAATKLAMQQALDELQQPIAAILVDGNQKMVSAKAEITPVIKGDAVSYSIAAASIIAKVKRDLIMQQLDQQYPQYGFAGHAGYGTKAHRLALEQYGYCPVHRKSFEPVKSMVRQAAC